MTNTYANLPFHDLVPAAYDSCDEAREKLAAVEQCRRRILTEDRYIKTERTVIGYKHWDRLRTVHLNRKLAYLREERRRLRRFLEEPRQERLL
jgi:hypothetical protein